MKQVFSVLLLLFAYTAFSQPCTAPLSQIDLQGNALRARLLASGRFGSDLSEASYHPNYVPGTVNPSTIFINELWYSGIDPGGNLKLNTAYFPGPLNPATGSTTAANCSNWDRFFRVTSAEIAAFLNDLSDGTLSAPHNAVRGWPARGNPFFSSITGFGLPDQTLAPFHDADGDGSYNPLNGDYPVVKLQGHDAFVPDEQIWSVVNDQGNLGPSGTGFDLPAEIHISYFVFNCPDKPLINNAMFTSYKLINRSTALVDSFSIALYTDFDLGCYFDDYVGCSPENSTFYAYNRTNTDTPSSSCSGIPSYGANPPVQAVTMLNKSLDFFIPIYNASVGNPAPATTDPNLPTEYFNYLHGRWRDNLPITSGGSGYDPNLSNPVTAYAFPGNPNVGSEWSMASASLSNRDQRGLGVHQVGVLFPGQILELTAAWTYHRSPGLSNLQNVDLMLQEVPHLHVLYDNNFADVCAATVSAKEPADRQSLVVWPNPAADEIYLHIAEAGSGNIWVFDQTGRSVLARSFADTENLRVETGAWPRGVYLVQVRTAAGTWMRKVVLH